MAGQEGMIKNLISEITTADGIVGMVTVTTVIETKGVIATGEAMTGMMVEEEMIGTMAGEIMTGTMVNGIKAMAGATTVGTQMTKAREEENGINQKGSAKNSQPDKTKRVLYTNIQHPLFFLFVGLLLIDYDLAAKRASCISRSDQTGRKNSIRFSGDQVSTRQNC